MPYNLPRSGCRATSPFLAAGPAAPSSTRRPARGHAPPDDDRPDDHPEVRQKSGQTPGQTTAQTTTPIGTAGPTDHPPAGVGSLWRLRGYLRPHRAGPRDHGDHRARRRRADDRDPAGHQGDHRRADPRPRLAPVLPLGLLALGARRPRGGPDLRAPVGAVQRGAQCRDRRCGTTSTSACSALPMSFHGQWQSGQLLSRVTTDLSRDPPVLRLRPAVPGDERPPGRRRHDRAAQRCTGRSVWWSRPPRSRSSCSRSASSGATSSCPGASRTSRATSRRWPRRARSASG